MSIPTGTDCPGAELVHRVKEVVSDPDTLVVVNCAGRTRSIIGCQSLLNAGLENRVVALENGTMGWELAGYAVDRGRDDHAPAPSADTRAWAMRAAAEVGERFGVPHVDHDGSVRGWTTRTGRRSCSTSALPTSTATAISVGSINAPGGQLVQATDEYVATRNARLVLVDDDGVRATMTASWLQQMGWRDAVVLDHALERAAARPGRPGASRPSARRRRSGRGARRTTRRPGRRGDRARPRYEPQVPAEGPHPRRLVGSTQPTRRGPRHDRSGRHPRADLDGRPARQSWRSTTPNGTGRARPCSRSPVARSRGATPATRWSPDSPVRPPRPNDVWYKPYDHDGDVVEQHMQDYLTWEIALVEQLARDETVSFPTFG